MIKAEITILLIEFGSVNLWLMHGKIVYNNNTNHMLQNRVEHILH